MTTSSRSWRIVLEATQARLTTGGRRGVRLLHAVPHVDGAFYLRPDTTLAGFALRLPLSSGGSLTWEAADLDRDAHAWLRSGRREVRAPIAVVCAAIPAARPYVKIVLETVFCSAGLLPSRFLPRPVTLRLFTEIRPAG